MSLFVLTLICEFINLSRAYGGGSPGVGSTHVITCSVCEQESIQDCRITSPTGQQFVVDNSLNIDNGRIKCLCNEVTMCHFSCFTSII